MPILFVQNAMHCQIVKFGGLFGGRRVAARAASPLTSNAERRQEVRQAERGQMISYFLPRLTGQDWTG